MDIKKLLNKIEDCKKETQRKELVKNLCDQILKPKNQKYFDQLPKYNYEKTLNKLYSIKEHNLFLELVTTIIQKIPTLSEQYRKTYQESILNIIMSKKDNNIDSIKANFNYFLIVTKDLDDISNVKHKEYLIYYMFFNVLIKLNLDAKIIDLFIKLEKYMSKYQYELVLYIFTIHAFIKKTESPDDFNEQMLILPKIIEFFKSKFFNESYLKNYDIIKYIFLMLLLYSPFKLEVLMDLYNIEPNLFMNLIQDIIEYSKNNFRDLNINVQEANNSNKICDKNSSYFININHFFSDDNLESELSLKENILSNNFNNKALLILEYQNFINRTNLKEIQEKNKNNIFKGIIWTLSSLILKSYYITYKSKENKDINLEENKNNCLRLFNLIISLFNNIDIKSKEQFVKQYLELIRSLLREFQQIEDWTHVLDIINMCLDVVINKDLTKENIEKKFKREIEILNEIFNIIFNINKDKGLLNCDIENLSILLFKFNQYIEKDIIINFYIDIYLKTEHKNKKNLFESDNDNTYINFINNLQTVVYNMVCSSPNSHPNAKNYLMELIKNNYINDNKPIDNENTELKSEDNKNDLSISKRSLIEKSIEKYLENFFICFGSNESNYSSFNYLLTEILIQSYNIKFVNKIITTLIFIKNSNINSSLYDKFIEQILGNLFENIINNYTKYPLSKEKFYFLIDFFYDKNNMNDDNILKIALKLLKCFIVNNRYEVFFANNFNNNNTKLSGININYNNRHSMIVIDYNYHKINQNKKKYKDEKEFEIYHKECYSPFTVFPHVYLFNSINYHLVNNYQRNHIFESILEFYYSCLNRNLYFLKNINFKEFLNLLLKEKDLTKIFYTKKITFYLLKILSSLPYQLHNELSFNSSEVIYKIKSSSYSSDDIQLLVDPKHKMSFINSIINVWYTLNSKVDTCLNDIFSNEQLNQTIFSKNNKNYNKNTIDNIIIKMINVGQLYLWCGELNLYTQFEYIYECIKILKLFLISDVNDILFVKKNSNNVSEKNLNESILLLCSNNQKSITFIKSIVLKIFSQIFNTLNYKYFNKKYAFFILSLLYEIKEIIILFVLKDNQKNNFNNTKRSFSNTNVKTQYADMMNISEEKESESLILNAIFISMFLSWNYENKIIEIFDKYLNTNYKSKISNKDKYIILEKYYKEKIDFDEGIQNLIENISDSLSFYLMEYIPQKQTSTLISIIDEIFPDHTSYREYFFYKMTEWTLKIKKNRDALNIDHRNIYDIKFLNNISSFGKDQYIGEKILENAQVFYGNNSLIVINPISLSKCCFTLRNPISHMNLIFDSNMLFINNTNINEEIDKEYEDENEEENQKVSHENNNEELNESKSSSFDSECDEFKQNDEEIMPDFLRTSTDKNLKTNYDLNDENKNSKELEYKDSSGDILWPIKKKNSENNINKNYEIKNDSHKKKESTEIEEKSSDSISNQQQNTLGRHRYNSDFKMKYKESILFYEQKKKMMDNCLKLFSIMAELTDYKLEQYKWIDLTKDNNMYNITKFVQNLDLLPVYYCYNCGLIYYNEAENDPKSLASYMYFIEKLGSLYDYFDFYPDNNKKDLSNKLINKDIQKDKYIIINQDSLIRVNFHVLNLTEKDKNKIIEENNIIFIWIDDFNNSYDFNTNAYDDKIKVFFIISKISESYFKIHRKYNQIAKKEIMKVIEELFLSEFIIDIECQSSIQMLLNMIMHIEILIKISNQKIDIKNNKMAFLKKQKEDGKNNTNISDNNGDDNNVKNIVLDNQNILISDDYINSSGCNTFGETESYLNEKDIMDKNINSFKKRYELINKLCQN